jgi:prophage maintenance system killer protein
VIAFEVPDLVVTASETLGLGTDATLDLLDLAIAEQALAEAKAEAGVDELAAAAALLHAIVLRCPFRRGNDRVALVATLQLLAMQGWRANLDPPAATMSVIAGITAGKVDAPAVREWLLPRLYCESDSRQGETSMRSWLPARRRRARRPRTSRAATFERFTGRARRAVVLAQEEARMLDHNYIGTEHLLLGLIREGEGDGDGLAARALESLGISLETVRKQVTEIIGHGQQAPSGHIPFTPRAKKVLQLGRDEARDLGHSYIGTEHILLGLIREGSGVAARVLTGLGVSLDRASEQVTRLAASRGDGDQQSA